MHLSFENSSGLRISKASYFPGQLPYSRQSLLIPITDDKHHICTVLQTFLIAPVPVHCFSVSFLFLLYCIMSVELCVTLCIVL